MRNDIQIVISAYIGTGTAQLPIRELNALVNNSLPMESA